MKNIAFLTLALIATALADDWPRWMGEKADSTWRELGIRKDLPKNGAKVLWRTPVGWCYSGPSVAEGLVFLPEYLSLIYF